MNEILPILTTHAPNLIGFILPPVIEVLNKDIPSDKKINIGLGRFSFPVEEKFLATLSICLCAAAVLNIQKIAVGSPEEVITSFGLIFTESQAVYRLYFKDSWLREKIQDATSEEEDPLLNAPGVLG